MNSPFLFVSEEDTQLKFVLKIGGFLFPRNLNIVAINQYINLLKKLYSDGHEFIVVTGGGRGAREYIGIAREIGANEAVCDWIGIEYTRLNARLLISGMPKEAFPEIPKTFQQVQKFTFNKILIMGGLQPGQSTNAVAALVSELINAEMLINATDVGGIYTEDPKKTPNAKILDKISIKDLFEMIVKKQAIAGSYELIDLLAATLIGRSKIPTFFLNGNDPGNIEKIIRGQHVGTKIIF